MAVIVDTSVWSLALRRRRRDLSPAQREGELLLRDMIVTGEALLLGVVRQELLTGLGPSAFDAVRDHLQWFNDDPPGSDDYERAASFANTCTRAGIAATTVDMLICSFAAGRAYSIFAVDSDFGHYAR